MCTLYWLCCHGSFYPSILYCVVVYINMVLLPLQACKFLDEKWNPKFTLIIAQKNHHTKFFIPGKPDNVPPGNLHHLPACSGNRVGSIFGDLVIFSNILDGFTCRNCGGQQSLPSKELRFLHVCACWNDRKHHLPLDLVCGHVSFWDCQFALK
jgi:hypothetical protein